MKWMTFNVPSTFKNESLREIITYIGRHDMSSLTSVSMVRALFVLVTSYAWVLSKVKMTD